MATHTLTLYRGATEYYLYTGNNTLLDYVPTTPNTDDLTVTESATVYMTAASSSALQTAIRQIEDLLVLARRRQATGVGEKVYVQINISGESENFRSEITDGRVILDQDALRLWGNTSAEVRIIWTRRAFWEGGQTALGLKRTGVAKTTSGVTIYNHHDTTTHENFVDIEGADVTGSLPSPLYIRLEQTAIIGPYRFFLSANTFHTPSSFAAIYEGESSTGGGTVTVDANSSNGNYMARSWTPSIDHTTNAFVWAISTAQLGYAAGGTFRVLVRFASAPPVNCYVKVKVKFPSPTPLTTIYEGPEILLDTSLYLQDLGTVPLPPGYVTGAPAALSLIISVRNSIATALNIDFIQLSGPDGVHRFDQQGYTVAVGDLVTVDGPENAVYIAGASDTQHIYSDYPPPLMVWPGRDMRLRLLFDESSSNMVIARTTSITAYYRVRRTTV